MTESHLQRPMINIATGYQSIASDLFSIVGRGKALRARLSGHGIVLPNSPTAGPAMAAITFPLTGELAHITSAGDLTRLIESLEALETALATPLPSGTVPLAAFATFMG
jgi:hypothetical protein